MTKVGDKKAARKFCGALRRAADPKAYEGLMPWCLDSSASVMVYRIWHPGEALVPDAAGIPAAAGQQVIPDILLVPCLGWSAKHFRLGYGGGYFDRYLAALAKNGIHPQVVGIAYAACKVDDALFDSLDLPMDFVITECGEME